MIKKQNIKRNPQRLKHKVRLDIEFYEDPKNKKIELLIVFIQKGGVADGKLLLGDIIKSINGIAVNNKEIQFDNEINKIISCFQNKIIETGNYKICSKSIRTSALRWSSNCFICVASCKSFKRKIFNSI